MSINNQLFNFTKTSVHMILYLLNWNLFARHKDSLAESTSCSTAERVQKGPQDEQLLQPEGALHVLCQEIRYPQLWERLGTVRASTEALKASEATMTESSARSPDPSGQH